MAMASTTPPYADKMQDPDADKTLVKESPTDTASSDDQNHGVDADEEPAPAKKTFAFYAIIVSLALTSLLTALEATIVSTALPTIVADLGSGNLFVWVVNGYYLTSLVPTPKLAPTTFADLHCLPEPPSSRFSARWPIFMAEGGP